MQSDCKAAGARIMEDVFDDGMASTALIDEAMLIGIVIWEIGSCEGSGRRVV